MNDRDGDRQTARWARRGAFIGLMLSGPGVPLEGLDPWVFIGGTLSMVLIWGLPAGLILGWLDRRRGDPTGWRAVVRVPGMLVAGSLFIFGVFAIPGVIDLVSRRCADALGNAVGLDILRRVIGALVGAVAGTAMPLIIPVFRLLVGPANDASPGAAERDRPWGADHDTAAAVVTRGQEPRPVSPSKDDILALLAGLREDGLGFWRRVEPERFWVRPDGGWSPAENVRHLTKCTTPVARALRLPRWILRTLFGVAEAPHRDLDALRSTYLAGLKRGAAAGRYAPAPAPPPTEPATGQQRVIEACGEAIAGLERAIRPWPEADLDRHRLPHPVLGPLSLREMLLFTVLHFDHHRDIVARRLADRLPEVPDSGSWATPDQD